MKKLLLSIALFSCATIAFAQTGKTFVLSNAQPIGQNLISNTPIQGMGYVFESPVNSISIDSKNNTALILIQHKSNYFNKGTLLNYDLGKNAAIWEKPVNMNKEKISLYPGIALIKDNKQTTALNPADGAPLWTTTTDFFYTDTESNIGIGFPQKKFTVSSELNSVDLTNGEMLWTRKLSHHFGINSITPLGNDMLLIVTDKIYAFNLRTNAGWEYAINTGTTTFPESVNLKIDSKYIQDVNYNFLQDGRTVCGIVSDPIIKDSKIYIASEDFLTCLSVEGNVEWKTALPEKLTSRSRIFEANGKIYVVNTGYVYFDNKKIQYGIPFVASFDIKSGQQNYLTKLEKGFIADYQTVGNTLFLIVPNKLVAVDLATGDITGRESLETPDHTVMVAFPHTGYYEEDGNKFNRLISGNTRIYFINENSKLVAFDLESKTFSIVPAEKLYRESFETEGYTCISQNKNSILLDSKGQPAVRLQMGAGCSMSNRQMYYVTENMLYTVNLGAVIGK